MGKKTRPNHIRLTPTEAYLAQQAIDTDMKVMRARIKKVASTDGEMPVAALERLQCRLALFLDAYLK